MSNNNAGAEAGSTLANNTAQDGGGNCNTYQLTLTNCTLTGNSASQAGGGIYIASSGTVTVEHYSSITGNIAPAGYGADVYNLGVLYLDSTSTIGILDGNPAQPI